MNTTQLAELANKLTEALGDVIDGCDSTQGYTLT